MLDEQKPAVRAPSSESSDQAVLQRFQILLGGAPLTETPLSAVPQCVIAYLQSLRENVETISESFQIKSSSKSGKPVDTYLLSEFSGAVKRGQELCSVNVVSVIDDQAVGRSLIIYDTGKKNADLSKTITPSNLYREGLSRWRSEVANAYCLAQFHVPLQAPFGEKSDEAQHVWMDLAKRGRVVVRLDPQKRKIFVFKTPTDVM